MDESTLFSIFDRFRNKNPPSPRPPSTVLCAYYRRVRLRFGSKCRVYRLPIMPSRGGTTPMISRSSQAPAAWAAGPSCDQRPLLHTTYSTGSPAASCHIRRGVTLTFIFQHNWGMPQPILVMVSPAPSCVHTAWRCLPHSLTDFLTGLLLANLPLFLGTPAPGC